MIRLSIALALAFATANLAPAASPDPKDLVIPSAEMARARSLVQRLGSDDFADRETAQAELAKMGRLARPALAEASAADPNPEVRSRAARLLPRAEAHELKARIDTFLADTELAYEHELPGWAEFLLACGADHELFGFPLHRDRSRVKAARGMFVEMLENDANRALLLAIGGPPQDLGALVANRRVELYNSRFNRVGPGGTTIPRRDITALDVLVLMFAEAQVSSRYVPTTRTTSMSLLVSSSGFSAAVNAGGETADIYRAVAALWLETRDDPNAMYQAITLASTLNLPGPGKRLAARLLDSGGGIISYRTQAVVMLVRFDGREHLPSLERLFNDPTPTTAVRIVNGVQQHEVTQMRDLALGACLLLTDQKPEDYGLASRYAGSSTRYISATQFYFPGDGPFETFAYRSTAQAKWFAWRAQHLEVP